MTIKTINLNKLLKLCMLPENGLISELRDDLRTERNKLNGLKSGGGDFHGPFWSDCKAHVIGALPLKQQTQFRIEAHRPRKRLYEPLCDQFLKWFDQIVRGTNEKVGWSEVHAHNHYPVPGTDLLLKVDNILGIKIGDGANRLIYPYFCESPVLKEDWARVGLWLMGEALDNQSPIQIEILDVLRARSFSGASLFLKGNEEAIFKRRYAEIVEKWTALRPEYGLH